MSLIINYIIYVICISKNLKYLKNEARNQKLKWNLLCYKGNLLCYKGNLLCYKGNLLCYIHARIEKQFNTALETSFLRSRVQIPSRHLGHFHKNDGGELTPFWVFTENSQDLWSHNKLLIHIACSVCTSQISIETRQM